MKVFAKVTAGILLLIVVAVVGVYVWASTSSSRILAQTHEVHDVDFPIPFPANGDAAGATADSLVLHDDQALAVERGRHLVTARYACMECHGEDFSGGTMVDAFPIGRLLGPNLTLGAGSRTLAYTPRDWDRIVRHGVLPDGRASVMPSEDFRLMSDQELSDIISYIRSFPPVDNEVPRSTLGPLGKFLVATGGIQLSASIIGSHGSPHRIVPPPAEVSLEFGEHLVATCTGCHGSDLSGGPIAGGDPSWPPARNLTPHPDALGGWSYENFVTALRTSTRPDGTPLQMPMTLVMPAAQRMTDVELQAMWTYLQSLPPVPAAG